MLNLLMSKEPDVASEQSQDRADAMVGWLLATQKAMFLANMFQRGETCEGLNVGRYLAAVSQQAGYLPFSFLLKVPTNVLSVEDGNLISQKAGGGDDSEERALDPGRSFQLTPVLMDPLRLRLTRKDGTTSRRCWSLIQIASFTLLHRRSLAARSPPARRCLRLPPSLAHPSRNPHHGKRLSSRPAQTTSIKIASTSTTTINSRRLPRVLVPAVIPAPPLKPSDLLNRSRTTLQPRAPRLVIDLPLFPSGPRKTDRKDLGRFPDSLRPRRRIPISQHRARLSPTSSSMLCL